METLGIQGRKNKSEYFYSEETLVMHHHLKNQVIFEAIYAFVSAETQFCVKCLPTDVLTPISIDLCEGPISKQLSTCLVMVLLPLDSTNFILCLL